MTIEVSLRDMEVDGVVYPVPTHLTWHKGPRRWAILLPDKSGQRLVIGFPAQRHGSVRAAYIAAIERLKTARKASEVHLQATRTKVYERKHDQTLPSGIELDVQQWSTAVMHYLRVSVGSYSAGTLLKRNLRVGTAKQYTKEHYDMVYAKALETRAYLLTKHAELVLKMRAESERLVLEQIQDFLRRTEPVLV